MDTCVRRALSRFERNSLVRIAGGVPNQLRYSYLTPQRLGILFDVCRHFEQVPRKLSPLATPQAESRGSDTAD